MFTRLSAKNFKSWRDAGDVELAPVTGFFGTNSSGKTSLLQTLLLLKQTAASADRRQVLNLGGDERSPVSLGLTRDIVHRHNIGEPLSFGFGWTPPTNVEPADPSDPSRPLFSADQVSFNTELTARELQASKNSAGELQFYLHPAVQAGIADVILEAAAVRRVQVIIESHSEHLLKRLQRRVAEGSVPPGQVALYFCQNTDGESTVDRLKMSEYGEILNWPQDATSSSDGRMRTKAGSCVLPSRPTKTGASKSFRRIPPSQPSTEPTACS